MAILDLCLLVYCWLLHTIGDSVRSVVDRFQELSEEVTAAVASVKGPKEKDPTLAEVDRLISGLQSLESSDPAAYRMLVERLRNAIGANDKA